MRDYLVFGIIFLLLPFMLRRPFIGVLAFTWVSLMNPHRLTYGAAYSFPFAAVITGVTLLGLFASRDSKRLPATPLIFVLIIFSVWMTMTCFFAFEPTRAWSEWDRVMKTFFMVFITICLINTPERIKAFAWIVGLSLGFYGLKGGLFTLLSGGAYRVHGPEDSYIADNNDMALALVMTVPVLWYLQLQATRRWLRYGLITTIGLTVIAAAGTYSRGALLGCSAMLFFLWIKSKSKIRTGVTLLLLLPLVYQVMPKQWFDRMDTIDHYQADSSAMGRINSWHFATNLAENNLFGGGFRTFTPRIFQLYAPEPLNVHAPHSIYFQVLGEHGFIGLALFLVFMLLAWRTGTRILKFCKGRAELKWASDLASLSQVSIVGYAVGGAFLTLAYYDLYYDIVVLLVCLEKLLLLTPQHQENKPDGQEIPTPRHLRAGDRVA
jgi:putative inorganic carbon (hco3(-)) transporter